MSDPSHDHFDLSEFVLGYLEEQGSIITPPEFGVHDVLIPEELAQRLAIDEYQHITFAAPNGDQNSRDALLLGVNHPLVETIAKAITRQPASGRAYINGMRLDKRGLVELAHKTVQFANARLEAVPNTMEQAALHLYLVFNFKVTFVSEEKQEELVRVVMDVQAGHAVRDAAILGQLEMVHAEADFAEPPMAAPRWPGAGAALSEETLQALLLRAERTLRRSLADQTTTLTARMERHLALDLARIGDYYDELINDLQQRRARYGSDDADRTQSLADKLTALEAERAAKLEDVRGRYALRVEMELVNALLVAQPKVMLPVTISNRTATVTRAVVWDPLTRRLEPLVCDVCGEPGEGLHLCTGGHLAHAACLAPQCIDCKRAFCQLCAGQISECAVCHRPVCRSSLITCPTCGRGVCREHEQLCHAANGQPASLPEAKAPSPAPRPAVAAPARQAADSAPSRPPAKTSPKTTTAATVRAGKAKPPSAPPPARPTAKGVRMDVEIREDESAIVAFVLKSAHRVLATRSFVLTPSGILVHCECEKTPCPADGYYLRPAAVTALTTLMAARLQSLQQEYAISAKKVRYYRIWRAHVQEEPRLALPKTWSETERVDEAIRGFDRLRR